MKWFIAILVLFLLIVGAAKLYNAGYDTAMAGVVFFIILPYFGILIATALEKK